MTGVSENVLHFVFLAKKLSQFEHQTLQEVGIEEDSVVFMITRVLGGSLIGLKIKYEAEEYKIMIREDQTVLDLKNEVKKHNKLAVSQIGL